MRFFLLRRLGSGFNWRGSWLFRRLTRRLGVDGCRRPAGHTRLRFPVAALLRSTRITRRGAFGGKLTFRFQPDLVIAAAGATLRFPQFLRALSDFLV